MEREAWSVRMSCGVLSLLTEGLIGRCEKFGLTRGTGRDTVP